MVIVLIEEKCLWCSEKLSGTIEIGASQSKTSGAFDSEHAVDVQSAGSDRVLKAINANGTCSACGTPFSYKAFSVMQMRARAEATPGQ